jgi:hypothetical protein
MSKKKGSEIIKVVTACVLSTLLLSAAFLVSNQFSMAMATRGSEVSVQMNGTSIAFDQPSIVLDEISMIPLSTVREVFDVSIDWNNDTHTVTIEAESVTVIMQVGSSVYTRNGEQITLDVPPQILGGRLLVPAHPLAESFGTEKQKRMEMESK